MGTQTFILFPAGTHLYVCVCVCIINSDVLVFAKLIRSRANLDGDNYFDTCRVTQTHFTQIPMNAYVLYMCVYKYERKLGKTTQRVEVEGDEK